MIEYLLYTRFSARLWVYVEVNEQGPRPQGTYTAWVDREKNTETISDTGESYKEIKGNEVEINERERGLQMWKIEHR